MKKIIALAMALALLFTAALAEDLSSLSDTELMEFYRRVGEEEEHRGLREKQEILDCVNRFFSCWFAGDTEGMLNVCSSEWMSSAEDPGEELLGILGNRKPLNLTLGEVSGEYGDDFRIVSCRVIMDNNDGRGPGEAEFRIEVGKDPLRRMRIFQPRWSGSSVTGAPPTWTICWNCAARNGKKRPPIPGRSCSGSWRTGFPKPWKSRTWTGIPRTRPGS